MAYVHSRRRWPLHRRDHLRRAGLAAPLFVNPLVGTYPQPESGRSLPLLIVTRLDRLARSTRDLLNMLHTITEKGAQFRSLADAWCDTTTPHGRLMTTLL